MNYPVIISLAVLKANWDMHHKDYIDNYLPFVAEVVRKSGEEVVSVPDIKDRLYETFQLSLPHNVILTILRRMKRDGLIEYRTGAYFRTEKCHAETGFSEARKRAERQFEGLVIDLIRFCGVRHSVDWTAEIAEQALVSYINDDRMLVKCVGQGTQIPDTALEDSEASKYIVSSYIQSLYDSDSIYRDGLEMIVIGNMLANAVFLPDPNQAARRFTHTQVYFDTQFLLYLLGYAGSARMAPCSELIMLLRESGAKLCCFDHTLEEMRGALNACAARLERGQIRDSYGPSMEYFLLMDKTASDVMMYVACLEENLRKLQVEVMAAPPYNEHEYVIDEMGLTEQLRRGIRYHNEIALQRDVKSIAAIQRLRRGAAPVYVEDCRALFVTTNTGLVRAASAFMCGREGQGGISPCITDYTLTNFLWLKKPMKAPELPRKRIIASYYAAIQPSDELWRRYLLEIDKLEQEGNISTEYYYLLRYEFSARSALMDLTLGDESAFTQGTVHEIIDVVRNEILKSEMEKYEEKLKASETIANEEIRKIENDVYNERIARIRAEEEANLLRQKEQDRRNGIVRRAEKQALSLRRTFSWVISTLFVIFTFSEFRFEIISRIQIIRLLLSIIAIFIAIINIINAIWGWSILNIADHFEKRICCWLLDRMLRDSGFDLD